MVGFTKPLSGPWGQGGVCARAKSRQIRIHPRGGGEEERRGEEEDAEKNKNHQNKFGENEHYL